MISDPIVVKVYVGDTPNDRTNFKNSVGSRLQCFHGLVLTPNEDSLILSTNQINISVQAIATVLHDLEAKASRVLTFRMKWKILVAEPKINHFIDRYFATVVWDPLYVPNTFDYGIVDYAINGDTFNSFNYNDIQIAEDGKHQQNFKLNKVYKMFMHRGFGSICFKPTFHIAFQEIKIYPELVHEVVSVLKRQALDDMPKTIQTMKTRLQQLHKLLQH
jgi:hypothetical protein